jgi:hypothetical protein
MKDSTIKLLFSGALVLGGLIAATTVTLTGIVVGLAIAEIVALQAPFSAALTGGVLFFLGHKNGNDRKNGH